MATGDLAALDNAGDIQSLLAMLNAIRPAGGFTQTQTTGPQTTETTDKTQTTEEIASPEAVQQLVQQMLQGNNGVAALASGEKTAGLYNSSTNQQLQNDLLSRVASAAAALNKKTVQTVSGGKVTTSGNTISSEKVMTPQINGADLAKAAAAAAAATALKNAINNMSKAGSGSSAGAQNAKKNDASAESSKKKAEAETAKLMEEWRTDPEKGNAWKTNSLEDRNAVDAFMSQDLGFTGTPRNSFSSPVTAALNASGAINDPTVESIMDNGRFLRTDENGQLIQQSFKQNPFSNLQNTDSIGTDQITQMMTDPNAGIPLNDIGNSGADLGGDTGFMNSGFDNSLNNGSYGGSDSITLTPQDLGMDNTTTSWWNQAGKDDSHSDFYSHFDNLSDYNTWSNLNSGHINGGESFGLGLGDFGGASFGWDD